MNKEELIEKHRDINTDHEWYDCVEENLRTEMEAIGFEVSDVAFSGFWCQGDGASFEGRITSWSHFCAEVPSFAEQNPNTYQMLHVCEPEYSIYRTDHRYSHEHTVGHEDTIVEEAIAWLETNEICEDALDDGDLRTAMYTAHIGKVENENASHWLKDFFKSRMRQLYCDLEAEYDHLTSDETVWESIVANGLDEVESEEDDAVRD